MCGRSGYRPTPGRPAEYSWCRITHMVYRILKSHAMAARSKRLCLPSTTPTHSPTVCCPIIVFIADVCEGEDSDDGPQQFGIGQEKQSGQNLDCIPADQLGCSGGVVAGDDHDGHYQPDVDWEHKL